MPFFDSFVFAHFMNLSDYSQFPNVTLIFPSYLCLEIISFLSFMGFEYECHVSVHRRCSLQ